MKSKKKVVKLPESQVRSLMENLMILLPNRLLKSQITHTHDKDKRHHKTSVFHIDRGIYICPSSALHI